MKTKITQTDMCRAGEVYVSQPRKRCPVLHISTMHSADPIMQFKNFTNNFSQLLIKLSSTRWSGDVMKRPGHKNFNAVSHNHSWPEVLFLNLTWRSRGHFSSVLLQLLLFAFSNREFGRHGKWSATFWQWENNT